MTPGPFSQVLSSLRRLTAPPANVTDRDLLQRFSVGGDESAFAALVQRHGPLVLGVCRRLLGNEHDAEDAFQAAFVLLARKAGSMAWSASVGNWLYEVAYRIAAQMRVRAARRQKHERAAAARVPAASEAPPQDWRELRGVIDEELYRLPEKFRLPLLLCYLHGQTRDEAAEQLGWSVGTVKGRLERGREMLRQRLTRRGLSLPAALMPLLLGQEASAAVPVALTNATIHSVISGAPAPPVVALVQGAMQAMFWTKVKAAAMLATVVVFLGGGAVAYHAAASSRPPGEPGEAPATQTVKPEKPEGPVWGEARGGLRVGLAPARQKILPGARSVAFTVWYENVGQQDLKVPFGHDKANITRLLFKGRCDGKDFFVVYSVERSKTSWPEQRTLAPGQKLEETFKLGDGSGSGWAGLPTLQAGQTLTLQVGLTPKDDPGTDKDWDDARTVTSGKVTLTCDDRAKVEPLIIDLKEDGKTVTARVGQIIEIRLVGDEAQTGWEGGAVKNDPAVLEFLKFDYLQKAKAPDDSIGTYTFRYKAVAEGEQEISLSFVSPSNPLKRMPRDATRLVKRFKVTVKVEALKI